MRERETQQEAEDRYCRAAHAMQSGVKFSAELGISIDMTPKHLRTGVNSALVSNDALVTLLVEKGIITREEYSVALADAMEREVDRYTKILEHKLGKKVVLE